MLLRKFKIGEVNYYCNELQIKEAGSLKAAAEKMAGIKEKKTESKPLNEK